MLGETQKAVDALFADYDRGDSPGCALGIVRDGRLIFARGYGQADLDQGIANTPQTAFGIGSESKQFTGAAVALLVEDGLLCLDHKVRQWQPALPARCEDITVGHLVHHTSGLHDYWDEFVANGMIERPVSQDELVDFAIHRFDRLDFEPGERCSYSNTGYLLLAVIVQAVSGVRFSEFLRQRILGPLGMRRTYVPDGVRMTIPNRATPYIRLEDGRFSVQDYRDDLVPGDGKMVSTIEDLAIWDGNFYRPAIGAGRFLELMHTPGRLNDGSTCRYGFGIDMGEFAPRDCRGIPLVTHGGAHGGFESLILRLPSRKLSVILLCNTRDKRFRPAAAQIAMMMCEIE